MKLGNVTDEQIAAAAQGDTLSLGKVAKAIRQPIYHLALRQLAQHDDALDVTQDVLLKVTSNLGTFKGDSQFSTWVWSIATRCIIDFERSKKKHISMSFEDFEQDLLQGLDFSVPANAENIVFVRQVKIGCARAMLQCMDAEHRIVYILGEILEFDQKHAADILEITHATFRKRLQRAREDVSFAVKRMCGVVNGEAKCVCRGRIKRAQKLNRLDSRDNVVVDVEGLQSYVRAIDNVKAAAEFFRADLPKVESK